MQAHSEGEHPKDQNLLEIIREMQENQHLQRDILAMIKGVKAEEPNEEEQNELQRLTVRNEYLEKKYQKYLRLKRSLKLLAGFTCRCDKQLQLDQLDSHSCQEEVPDQLLVKRIDMLQSLGVFGNQYKIFSSYNHDDYQVSKGLNNFLELRNQLVIKGFKMPDSGKVLEINSKKATKKALHTDVLSITQQQLLKFLQDLASNPDILKFQVFLQFLGIDEGQQLELQQTPSKKVSYQTSPKRSMKKDADLEFAKKYSNVTFNDKEYVQKTTFKHRKSDLYTLPSENIKTNNTNKVILQNKIENKIDHITTSNLKKPH